jgi:peptidoglycan/LPS O-acetylase OafA/YrhL
VARVGVAALGSGFGVTLSIYRSVITGFAPEALRGGLVGIAEALGRVSATVTPIAMGAVLAMLVPAVGFPTAVHATVVGVAVLGGAGGVACLLVAVSSPPVRPETGSE